VVVDRNREDLFRVVLPDNKIVERALDLSRLNEANRRFGIGRRSMA